MGMALYNNSTARNHTGGNGAGSDASPERLGVLAQQLNTKMERSLSELMTVNQQTILLSINARVEAARAGLAGASFEIVAGEMNNLAKRTSSVFETLSTETNGLIKQVENMSLMLATQVRGTRLSDLALTNIDLIDRNLYERSCDVRWWATDGSVTAAAASPTSETCVYASQRLGQILDSYTVYYDLVLCDLKGHVIANGRPKLYRSQGKDQHTARWFAEALATSSGDEFGFQGVHASPLVNGNRILAYSCGVRTGGKANGKLIGVLGVLFNWDSLAQTIVKNVSLPADELARTRVIITDDEGAILADNRDRILEESVSFSRMPELYNTKKGFLLDEYERHASLIAHAQAPGYETYSTGWHSLILQQLK